MGVGNNELSVCILFQWKLLQQYQRRLKVVLKVYGSKCASSYVLTAVYFAELLLTLQPVPKDKSAQCHWFSFLHF